MKQEKYWSHFFDNQVIREKETAKRLTFSSEANRQSIYEAIQSFIQGHFAKVLDVGTGAGDLCLRLNTKSNFIVAIDISFEMLKSFQKNILFEKDLIAVACASVIHPPFSDGCFDLVIASEVLQYVPFSSCILQLIALLKPKGVLVISVPHKKHPAIVRARTRRNNMYNGVGTEDLENLVGIEGIACLFMPLYIEDTEEKRYVRGKIFKDPAEEAFQNANRLIIKVEKTT